MPCDKDIFVCSYPEWQEKRISSTFWQDFCIADAFGLNAVQDTFNRAFGEWKTNYKMLTELVGVLKKISEALKPDGILYTSFKYGDFEGIRGGRYFTDLTEESLAGLMAEVPSLQIVDIWITNDVRPGREEERWINILARRI